MSSPRGERILLVDDTPTNLHVLVRTLDRRGFELLVARSGEEALEVAREARPALVLLDIMMPGMDGFETCRRMKADPDLAAAAIIFMSALDDTGDKVRGLDLGAVDYITKPFQADEVIARVSTHLTVQQLQADLARRNEELRAANRRMKQDLDQAARVQRALLPRAIPACDGFRFAWSLRPCDELAGDSLNIFALDPRHVGLYVLDVSGHGVRSALLSVAAANTLSQRGPGASIVTDAAETPPGYTVTSPPVVAARLNAMYPMADHANQYLTMAYALLDLEAARLRFTCAGHPGPAILHADGSVDVLEVPAIPIGLQADSVYVETTLDPAPGDRVFFYSDGLVEELNAGREPFGSERFEAALRSCRGLDLDDAIATLIEHTVRWKGDPHLSDDVSVIAVERR